MQAFLDILLEIYEFVAASLAAYFSIVGGAFISLMPLPGIVSLALFMALNFALFIKVIAFVFSKSTSFKSPLLLILSLVFGIFSTFVAPSTLFGVFWLLLALFFFLKRIKRVV